MGTGDVNIIATAGDVSLKGTKINVTERNIDKEVDDTKYATENPTKDTAIIRDVSSVGAVFSSSKFPIASALYQQALYGNGEHQQFNTDSSVATAIVGSDIFKNKIRDLAKDIPVGTTVTYSTSIRMDDTTDHLAAFGNVKLAVTITANENGSLTIEGKAEDLYNFEHMDVKFYNASVKYQAIAVANNLAADLQEKGLLHPYTWEADLDTTI